MYLFAIISSLICTQLLSTASSDTNAVNPNLLSHVLAPLPTTSINKETLNNENQNDEGYVHYPRLTSSLRFGRQVPSASASASFLRFGRSHPFIVRFDRGGHKGGTFLRFGRQNQRLALNKFHLFGNNGEFLRFG
ncbi:unnamed protein product [Rotaria sp. Silwood1]|nr:unnamed protein product [Rotaria sp. Silwood1]CAF0967365.1 unnamed protein product [Rotaria sp. Silwood1]CAF0976651.1 unnamed protein product [Rotaria sp. Silwood1]CAF3409083.1 unnamed protein product [Rotaria sp. Silwood1]CAF3409246.1 unnamed protein product [Rotaria sp. Silwood1]